MVISANAVNRLPLVVTVVIGTKADNITRDFPSNVRLASEETGLPIETVFLCFQVRSLDPTRFESARAGMVSGAALARIDAALRRCLAL
jgi:mRNA interferase MazF